MCLTYYMHVCYLVYCMLYWILGVAGIVYWSGASDEALFICCGDGEVVCVGGVGVLIGLKL